MTTSAYSGQWMSRLLIIAVAIWFSIVAEAQQKQPGAEQLGMALEYFQSGKYHESLLIFQNLDKRYKLNPRFRAYMGLCYYYEWNYKKSAEYFDTVLPALKGLAPHELSVYYYAAGESYFQMQQYSRALPYYQDDLAVCYNQEKGDVYYRIGLCHMFAGEWQEAYDSYTRAETCYRRYRAPEGLEARMAQISNMKNGCMRGITENIDQERSRMLRKSGETTDTDHNPDDSNVMSPWDSMVIGPFPVE